MPPVVAAAAIAAGGAFGGAALNARSTGKAAKASTDAANRAAELQKQTSDETIAFQKEQAAQDQARWEAAQRANYAQYVNRAKAAQGLGRSIGFDLPDPAAYESSLPQSAGGQPAVGSVSGGSAAALKTLLDQGMDPRQAAAQFNKQYGRSTGNEAVYYDPSQHGGVATIGLPDAYLSLEKNGWSITPRAGGGSGAAPARSIAAVMPTRMIIPTPTVGPFQLRSINAFMR